MPELVKGIDLKFYNGKSIGLRPPEFKSQWLRLFFFLERQSFSEEAFTRLLYDGTRPFPLVLLQQAAAFARYYFINIFFRCRSDRTV